MLRVSLTLIVILLSTFLWLPAARAAAPVLTENRVSVAQNAPNLVISGTGFGSDASLVTVSFTVSSGTAPTGTVSSCTDTSIKVTVTGLSNAGIGPLRAIVTVSGTASGSTLVAMVAPPVTLTLTAATTNLLSQSAKVLSLSGSGFSVLAADNIVTFSSPSGVTGQVIQKGLTTLSMSISVTGLSSATVGSLVTLTVTTRGVLSSSVTIGSVVLPATLTANTAETTTSATQLILSGTNFAVPATNNIVTFFASSGTAPTGKVVTSGSSSTTLVVVMNGLFTTALGNLMAVVTSNGGDTSKVQVAALTDPIHIILSTYNVAANAPGIVISGSGFHTDSTKNIVTFSVTGGVTPTGTITSSTSTRLVVSMSGLSSANLGALKAIVTSRGGSCPSTSVATIIASVSPTLVGVPSSVAQNAVYMYLVGTNFSINLPSENKIEFAVTSGSPISGTVVWDELSATSIKVQLGGLSSAALGTINVLVKVREVPTSQLSFNLVANANVTVTPNTWYKLAPTSTTLQIRGYGFSTDASLNLVKFIMKTGASFLGTVSPTGLTNTKMTVNLSNVNLADPGVVQAIVTVMGTPSAAIQVATLTKYGAAISGTWSSISDVSSSTSGWAENDLRTNGGKTVIISLPPSVGSTFYLVTELNIAILRQALVSTRDVASTPNGWNTWVSYLLPQHISMSTDMTVMTISVPKMPNYNTPGTEYIQVVVPPALNTKGFEFYGDVLLIIRNDIGTAVVGGSFTLNAPRHEGEIKTRQFNVTITLSDDEWSLDVATGTWHRLAVQALFQSSQTAGDLPTGWAATVLPKILTYTRTSSMVLTVIIPAISNYQIFQSGIPREEIITIKPIPTLLLQSDGGSITPTNAAVTIVSDTVPDPPLAPLKGDTLSSSYINIKWSAPSNSGGSPITGYRVFVKLGQTGEFDSGRDVGNSTLSLLVPNLVANSPYYFKVSAKNVVGFSMRSAPSDPIWTLPTTTSSSIKANGQCDQRVLYPTLSTDVSDVKWDNPGLPNYTTQTINVYSGWFESLLSFDLSSIKGNVIKATLRLYCTHAETNGYMYIQKTDSFEWSSSVSLLRWTNRPVSGATFQWFQSNTGVSNLVDVTAQIKSAIQDAGGSTSGKMVSFRIFQEGENLVPFQGSGRWVRYASVSNTDYHLRPFLDIQTDAYCF